MLRMVPWYRWFGLLLEDFFTGTAYGVRLEEELSLKRQFLDVLILRWGDGPEPKSLPDGLEGLGEHNLVTYKSSAESLDLWALDELFGHYVNYRKQLREQNVDALESAFRFYAVSPTTRAACSNR